VYALSVYDPMLQRPVMIRRVKAFYWCEKGSEFVYIVYTLITVSSVLRMALAEKACHVKCMVKYIYL